MRTHSGVGLAALVLLSGGCLQILGYKDTTVIDSGTGGGGGSSADCTNGKKDGDEVDVDCGGSTCGKCALGKGCANGADCASLVCGPGGTCLAPACDDKVKNGDESDVDCGGATCGKCAAGGTCGTETDCASGACVGGLCSATCSDGMKNGAETGLDCGGGCAGCKDGEACASGPDCGSGVCQEKACVSSYVWAKRFGDAQDQTAQAIVSDAMGNTFITGITSGTTEFGNGPLTSASATAFLAKLAPSGNALWSYALASGGMGSHFASGSLLAVNGDKLVLAGYFQGTLDFGAAGTLLSLNPVGDVFVAGVLQGFQATSWATKITGTAPVGIDDVAVDATGSTFVLGPFSKSVTIGGTTHNAAGKRDLYLAKLNTSGGPLWSTHFGTSGLYAYSTVAADGIGNTVLSGGFVGTADFGGGPLVSMGSLFPQKLNIFVAKLGPSGEPLWSTMFGATTNQNTQAVAVDPVGNVLLLGNFTGTLDLGGGPIDSIGADNIFVAKLDPAGKHIWTKRLTAAGATTRLRLAVDAVGALMITGTFDGTLDFGGATLASNGNTDVFVAKLDSSGQHLWSKSFGDTLTQQSAGIALGGSNSVVFAGSFESQIDFGGGALNSVGAYDIFLAKLLLP